MLRKIQASSFRLCPNFDRTFKILGRKWNGLIIEALIVCGHSLRFKEISQVIAKCSDRVLVERLRELSAAGIIQRHHYSSTLVKYRLTKKGRELAPIMKMVHKWADKWCD